MVKKVRLGFVGAGHHASESLYPCLRYIPDCELIAVCDVDRERGERNAKTFAAERVYTQFEDMVANELLDGVLIVGSPEMHYTYAVQSLDRGIHVFTEKPPARTLELTLEIHKMATKAGRNYMPGFMKRFAGAYRKMKEIMSLPEFGQPTSLVANFGHCRFNYEHLHDLLIMMTIHLLDLVRFLMGDVERLTFEKVHVAGTYTVGVQFKFSSGTIGHLLASGHQTGIQEWVQVTGEDSCLYSNDAFSVEWKPSEEDFTRQTVHSYRPIFTVPHEKTNALQLRGYLGELEEFVNAIREDRRSSPDSLDAVKAMQLAEIISKNKPGTFSVEQK
jgi:myo-inositol 2-dehydrogenase/D-chiro-inositol 1-dehydrogenase